MVPDLSLMKSAEKIMCILRFWACCYLKPVAGGAGYMEVVFLHHATSVQFEHPMLLHSKMSLALPPWAHWTWVCLEALGQSSVR